MLTDLVSTENLDEKELMAMILHGVGHNVYICPLLFVSKMILGIFTFPTHIVSKFILFGIGPKLDEIQKKYLAPLCNP